MILLSLISLIVMIMIIIQFRRKMYEDRTFTKKVKLPIGGYLICILLSMIPIVGFIAVAFALWIFYMFIREKEAFYKPGWFIKLLMKEV